VDWARLRQERSLKHPSGANDATKQYATEVFQALLKHVKPMTVSRLGSKVTRPHGATRLKHVLKDYACFKVHGDKNPRVSLV
jgi:hypothetical protein